VRQLNFVDSFSMTAGTHQLKFGIDFRRMKPTNAALAHVYTSFACTYESFLSGTTNFISVNTNDPITAKLDNYSLFA